jgi:DnaK suppressor protein
MYEKVKPLTNQQLDVLKQKLLDEKQSLAIKDLTAPVDLDLANPSVGDEVEQSINDYNNSHELRFRNREAFYVKKIDKALKKFDQNEFGLCDECGSWIKFERLLARPTADLCIFCKEESERDELNNISGKQSKSLGKVFDLTGMMA